MEDIRVTTYMYSRSGRQQHPLYVDGAVEQSTASDYFHSFISNICCAIDQKFNSCLTKVDNYSEWGAMYTVSKNGIDTNIDFSISPDPAPCKDNDIMQKVYATREWLVHHVSVNNQDVDDWSDVGPYLVDLLTTNSAFAEDDEA